VQYDIYIYIYIYIYVIRRLKVKTLIILLMPCGYIMEIVYCIKVNIGRLEQNSGIIMVQVIDQVFNPSSLGQIFKKRSLNNMGEKLYNTLPNHFKNLENKQLFRRN
jgi:hypothetical protein